MTKMLSFGTTLRKVEDQVKRISFNVGAGLDVPSGRFEKGLKGESILVGGVSYVTAVVGAPNTLKTTILQYMILKMVKVMFDSMIETRVDAFDTEQTMIPSRVNDFIRGIDGLEEFDILNSGVYTITDAVMVTPDQWLEEAVKWLEENKIKAGKKMRVQLPIMGLGNKPMEMYVPTISLIDSLSEMITEAAEKIEEENTVSDSGGNMFYARDGLAKKKFLSRLSRVCNRTDNFLFMSAHVGPKYSFSAGPFAPPPTRDLPTMSPDEKIKGAPDKFLYLPQNVYQTTGVGPLNNKSNRMEDEYPRDAKDKNSVIDLMRVRLRHLRSKTGQDGYNLNIAVSRSTGVNPEVTELEILREAKDFGIERSGVGGSNFMLKIYPHVKFTRNTFIQKVEEDPKLRRALNITSEICQMHQYHPQLAGITDFDDFVAKIEEQYGWDNLLNTRGYFTINQYTHPVPYLSCKDIIDMYKGTYVPYWWKGKDAKEKKDKKEK